MGNVGNFSKDPAAVLKANLEKGYVGVRIEQGVPLLDRDLNLQSELLAATQRALLERYIGNGSASVGNAGRITALASPGNGFTIGGGKVLVGGIEVNLATVDYRYQPSTWAEPGVVPPTLTVVKPNAAPRLDTVYLDVWQSEVPIAAYGAEIDLLNLGDVQRRTTVRTKAEYRVRVAEGAPMPTAVLGGGHAYYKLATILRASDKIVTSEITDCRVENLKLSTLVQQLNTLQADIALIKTSLQPAFSPVREFDHAQGYPGRAGNPAVPGRVVTLYGRNFHLGDVTVDIIVDKGGGNVVTHWDACEIIGDVRPNSLTVRIKSIVQGGDAVFRVNTAFGSASSVTPFRMFAAPIWGVNPGPWLHSTPGGPYTNMVLLGSLFDCPGTQIQLKPAVGGMWADYTIQAVSKTSVTIWAPYLANGQQGYVYQARNEANPNWVQGPGALIIT